MAYCGATPAEAEQVLTEVCAWWRLPPETLPRVVAALGGHQLIPEACLLWLYWTTSLAHRPQLAELLVYAVVHVGSDQGVARELLDVLELHFAEPRGLRQ